MNSTNPNKVFNYIPLLIFAVSMGFLEAIVVVYVRELYYPEGFNFPLKAMPEWIILIELFREISTLLMLGSVAWIAGKSFLQRLSAFLFLFGFWDIIYYVALKLFIDWPESMFTWDILFLIPITWVGPVLAPVLCSVVMIAMAFTFDYLQLKRDLTRLKTIEFFLLILGSAIIYYTFTVDFGMIILNENFLAEFFNLPELPEFVQILETWTPTQFNWIIFSLGLAIILCGFYLTIQRSFKK